MCEVTVKDNVQKRNYNYFIKMYYYFLNSIPDDLHKEAELTRLFM